MVSWLETGVEMGQLHLSSQKNSSSRSQDTGLVIKDNIYLYKKNTNQNELDNLTA